MKERVIDARLVDHAIRDVGYGLRLLARSPIFTSVAILSLSLGIGANAAIFQLIDTISLRQLPVAHSDQLVEVHPDGPQAFGNYDGVNAKATYPLWDLIRAQQQAFSSTFAWGDAGMLAGRGADARLLRGLWVSGSFFPALDIAAERGRLLGPDDDRRGCGAESVVVSHAYWQARLGHNDAAVGSTLTLFDQPFTIVGVVPAYFTGVEVGQAFDVAVPLCAAALVDGRLEQRERWWLTVMGRLKPDWTIAQADNHLRVLSPALLDATVPPGYDPSLVEGYRRLRFGVTSAAHGVSRLRDEHASSLTLLLTLTGLVLLMTCGNLAMLMLARASAREREIAVRAACGASRVRLVAQMLVESLLVAVAGAVLAVPMARGTAHALIAFLDTATRPVALNLAIDWRLLVFIGTTATLTTVLFGVLPALRASVVDPNAVMRQTSRGLTIDRQRAHWQRGLVVAQVAVSLVLVFAAWLFIETFHNLAGVSTGFDADRTLAVSFLDRASKDLSPQRKTAFQEQLRREIQSVPGVISAASSTHVPLSGAMWSHFFRVVGVSDERKASRFAYVSPGYFATLRVPIRSGRDFDDFDSGRSQRVMLVNESFVRAHLGGRPPIGAPIRTVEEPGFPEVTYDIIGVVGDTKYADLRAEDCWCGLSGGSVAPIAYVPIAQNPSPYAWASIIVRSNTPVASLTPAIARRVAGLNPAIATGFTDLKRQIRDRLQREEMIAWIAGAFGVLAMVLVAVGIYGIIAYLEVSRRHEFGIRLALGSTPAQIAGLVLRDNLWLIGTGLALGLPLAIASMLGARALLFGLTPTNVPAAVGAACLLTVVGVFAAAVPAIRAARVRPDEAFRCD